ncbi:hypothetical protein EYF80_013240 [Liparis tanakae]|uniref:Uncharacterized protein n=1 Tax=Liparis tanakae TaxID=230148 RepID=A0A4Z2IFB2_9TELE|nr:hypothetical protein EYF80_013240 [Liparis tanakae]
MQTQQRSSVLCSHGATSPHSTGAMHKVAALRLSGSSRLLGSAFVITVPRIESSWREGDRKDSESLLQLCSATGSEGESQDLWGSAVWINADY